MQKIDDMRMSLLVLTAAGLTSAAAGQTCAPDFQAIPIDAYNGFSLSVNGADLDADGDVDILLPGHHPPLQWLVNDGERDPTFTTRDVESCGAWGELSLATADLDADGDVDLVTVNEGGDLMWYENVGGDPPEFCARFLPDTISGTSCATADLDADGDVDLLASESDYAVIWFENDGQRPPAFARRAVGPVDGPAYYLRTGDVARDGALDFIAITDAVQGLSLFMNDGAPDPTFTRFEVGGQGVRQAVIADLDADGDGDIAVAGSGHVAWLETLVGQPPAFDEHVLSTEADARSVVVGDMDRDGRPDIVVGTRGEGDLWVFFNQGGLPPSFQACQPASLGDPIQDLGIADLDGDYDPDVFGREIFQAFWFENLLCLADFDGNGAVDTRDFLAFLNAWNADHPGADINGDGAFNTLDVLAFLNLWVRGCP